MSLVYTFSELRVEAAYKAGWGADSAVWTTGQTERLLAIVNSGYRFFLFPPISIGDEPPHTWSFLLHGGQDPTTLPDSSDVTGASAFTYADEQVAQLQLTMGIDEYPLPADFGGIIGEMVFRPIEPGGGGYGLLSPQPHDKRLSIVNDTVMRTMQANQEQVLEGDADQGNYPPQYASFRRGRFDTTTGVQPYRLILFPKPDNAYALLFQYYSMPQDRLGPSNENPLCPPEHAETLKAAVLAAAELMLDDRQDVYWARFKELLTQSIAYDKRTLNLTDEAFPVTGLIDTIDQDYLSIAIQVGLKHGFPPNPRSWSRSQQQMVYYELQSAVRQVLTAKNWKFTKPLQLIRLQAGKSRYDLPVDYDQIIGELTFMSAEHLASAYEQ